jgi:hypothetical protein
LECGDSSPLSHATTRRGVTLTADQSAEIVELLVNGVPSPRVAILVGERGLDFAPTDQWLEITQVTGGDETLITRCA